MYPSIRMVLGKSYVHLHCSCGHVKLPMLKVIGWAQILKMLNSLNCEEMLEWKKSQRVQEKKKNLWKRNLLKNASFRVEQNLLKKMKNGSKRKKLNFSKKLLFGVFIGKQIKRKMKFFQNILGFNKNLSFFQLFRVRSKKIY